MTLIPLQLSKGLSRPINCLLCVIWGLTLPFAFPDSPLADQELSPQIVVYVDDLELLPGVTEVTVLSAELVGKTDTAILELTQSDFVRKEPLSRQLRLVDQEVPEGDYRKLRFRSVIDYDLNDTTWAMDTVVAFVSKDLHLSSGDVAAVFVNMRARGWGLPDGRAQFAVTEVEAVIPPSNSQIFVSNEGSNNISLLDKSTGRVVDVFVSGRQPRGMVVSRLAQELYVANAEDNSVSVFDVTNRQRLRTLRLNLGDEPSRLALSPDGRQLYVLNTGSNSLSVFDAVTYQEAGRFSVGLQPVSLDVDRITGWVYISNELSDDISVYDPGEEILLTTIPAVSLPGEIVVVPSGNLLCVASTGQRNVTVLSSSTGNVVATVSLCAAANALAFDPVRNIVYASTPDCEEITTFQPSSTLSIGHISMPGIPGLLTIDTDERTLYAMLPEQDGLAIVNLTGKKIITVVHVGANPYMAVETP